MTLGQMLRDLHEYVKANGLSLDSTVYVEVFHDDETSEIYPATIASGHAERGEVVIYAQAKDDPQRN